MKYKHYKGAIYELVGTANPLGEKDFPSEKFIKANHTETLKELRVCSEEDLLWVKGTERLVIYYNVKKPEVIWAREYGMFFESVEKDGELVPRFKQLDS